MDECKPLATGASRTALEDAAGLAGADGGSGEEATPKDKDVAALQARLVHFAAQLEPFLTQKQTLNTPDAPYYPLNTPETTPICTPCRTEGA